MLLLVHPFHCLLTYLLLCHCLSECEWCPFFTFTVCWLLSFSVTAHQYVSATPCSTHFPPAELFHSVSAYQDVDAPSHLFCLLPADFFHSVFACQGVSVAFCSSCSLLADISLALSLLTSLWVLSFGYPCCYWTLTHSVSAHQDISVSITFHLSSFLSVDFTFTLSLLTRVWVLPVLPVWCLLTSLTLSLFSGLVASLFVLSAVCWSLTHSVSTQWVSGLLVCPVCYFKLLTSFSLSPWQDVNATGTHFSDCVSASLHFIHPLHCLTSLYLSRLQARV